MVTNSIVVCSIPNQSQDVMIIETRSYKKYWLFGRIVTKQVMYRGSGTVWHYWPSVKRCPTHIEEWLCGIWKYNDWRNK